MKHIRTLHDGEARSVGDPSWKHFSASGGEQYKACFGHYQFARNQEVRKFLLAGVGAEALLDDDVD